MTFEYFVDVVCLRVIVYGMGLACVFVVYNLFRELYQENK